MQSINGAALDAFAAAVIAGGGIGAGMAHEFLHGNDVGAGIEQGAGKGAAHVVGREGFDIGPLAALFHNVVDGHGAETVGFDLATFEDARKERASRAAALVEPVINGAGQSQSQGHGAHIVTLAAPP